MSFNSDFKSPIINKISALSVSVLANSSKISSDDSRSFKAIYFFPKDIL